MFNVSMFSMMFTDWMKIVNFKVNPSTRLCIRMYHRQFMSGFELWLDDHEDRLRMQCSENGCYYELDFDFETYCEEQYELAGGIL